MTVDLLQKQREARVKKALANEIPPSDWTVSDMLFGLSQLADRDVSDITDKVRSGIVAIRDEHGEVSFWAAGNINADQFLAILENLKLQLILQKVNELNGD